MCKFIVCDLRLQIISLDLFPYERSRFPQMFSWIGSRSKHWWVLLVSTEICIDILTEVGMLGCKPAWFPIDQQHGLTLVKDSPLPQLERYRRLVGRLVYFSTTWPDITYSIHILTQFMQQPHVAHWDAAMHVIRYLKGTLGQGILLRASPPIHITGWSDFDWEGCPLTRRSLTGWIVQIGTSIVFWKTQKQDIVTLSSTEAEYRAMKEVLRELKWVKVLLLDFGIQHTTPMTLLR